MAFCAATLCATVRCVLFDNTTYQAADLPQLGKPIEIAAGDLGIKRWDESMCCALGLPKQCL